MTVSLYYLVNARDLLLFMIMLMHGICLFGNTVIYCNRTLCHFWVNISLRGDS